jgi:hypothetical protein
MGRRLLTAEQVREARAWYARWKAIPSIKAKARDLGINECNLRKAVRGVTYRNVV